MDRWILPGGDYSRALYSRPRRYSLTGPTAHSVQVWHEVTKHLGWDRRLTLAQLLFGVPKSWGAFGKLKGLIGGISLVYPRLETSGLGALSSRLPLSNSNITWPVLSTIDICKSDTHSRLILLVDPPAPEASPLEDRILDGHLPERSVSLIYKKLINNMKTPSSPSKTNGLEMALNWTKKTGKQRSPPRGGWRSKQGCGWCS